MRGDYIPQLQSWTNCNSVQRVTLLDDFYPCISRSPTDPSHLYYSIHLFCYSRIPYKTAFTMLQSSIIFFILDNKFQELRPETISYILPYFFSIGQLHHWSSYQRLLSIYFSPIYLSALIATINRNHFCFVDIMMSSIVFFPWEISVLLYLTKKQTCVFSKNQNILTGKYCVYVCMH